jgi:CcmD family protein
MIRRSLMAISTFAQTVVLTAVPVVAFQPPPGQDGFVPAKNLAQTESIPAAPLLVTAYAFIWVAAIFYLWTIWRRLNKVEADIRALERTAKRTAP